MKAYYHEEDFEQNFWIWVEINFCRFELNFYLCQLSSSINKIFEKCLEYIRKKENYEEYMKIFTTANEMHFARWNVPNLLTFQYNHFYPAHFSSRYIVLRLQNILKKLQWIICPKNNLNHWQLWNIYKLLAAVIVDKNNYRLYFNYSQYVNFYSFNC